MIDSVLKKIKALVPRKVFRMLQPYYHWLFGVVAPMVYGNPSNKLIVIGITGTKGKSSTSYILARILESAGLVVGMSSGILFKVAGKEWLNDYKMTMPGRFVQQRLLRDMVRAGCTYAVVETTSEGIKQFRHLGINYDVVVFTNLFPEHIESHGSYENYRAAKGRLFKHLMSKPHKEFFKHKIQIVNADDQEASFFSAFDADEKHTYSTSPNNPNSIKAQNISMSDDGLSFSVGTVSFSSPLLGKINIYNLLAAITTASALGISLEKIADAVKSLSTIPGRLEFIDQGQAFEVVVDYAHEPESLEQVLSVASERRKTNTKIIHVFGATGGGRDRAKREKMGTVSDMYADKIILTNDDPYDDDEKDIINDIMDGIADKKKVSIVVDRKKAIEQALRQATDNDVVLITGKGSEQAIMLKDGKHQWDDREIVKTILNSL